MIEELTDFEISYAPESVYRKYCAMRGQYKKLRAALIRLDRVIDFDDVVDDECNAENPVVFRFESGVEIFGACKQAKNAICETD